jgi:hypothetical protein
MSRTGRAFTLQAVFAMTGGVSGPSALQVLPCGSWAARCRHREPSLGRLHSSAV